MAKYYYREPGAEACGPITEQGLQRMIRRGTLTPTDEIRREDQDRWMKVANLCSEKTTDHPVRTGVPEQGRGIALGVGVAVAIVGLALVWFFLFKGGDKREQTAVDERSPAPQSSEVPNLQPAKSNVPAVNREAADNVANSSPTEVTNSKVDPERTRVEYLTFARAMHDHLELVLAEHDLNDVPTRRLASEYRQATELIEDPALRAAAANTARMWGAMPGNLPRGEGSTLEHEIVDYFLGVSTASAHQAWENWLRGIQSDGWGPTLSIVEELWGDRATSELTSVRLETTDGPSGQVRITLSNTSGRLLTDATIRVEFERFGRDPALSHFLVERWQPGAELNLSKYYSLLRGGAFVTATAVSVWCNEARQPEQTVRFPKRESALREYVASNEELRAELKQLIARFGSGTRFEGEWRVGIHSGALGLEFQSGGEAHERRQESTAELAQLVSQFEPGAPFEVNEWHVSISSGTLGMELVRPSWLSQRNLEFCARLYVPSEPTLYKEMRGVIEFDRDRRHFAFRASEFNEALREAPHRDPRARNLVSDQDRREYSVFLDPDGIVGTDSTGGIFQLGTVRGSTAPERAAGDRMRPPLTQRIEPIPNEFRPARAEVVSRPDQVGEVERFDTEADKGLFIPRVTQVWLSRDERTLIWNRSGATVVWDRDTQNERLRLLGDHFLVDPAEQFLYSGPDVTGHLFDYRTGEAIGVIDLDYPGKMRYWGLRTATMSPAGDLVGAIHDSTIEIWSADGQLQNEFRQTGKTDCLRVSDDGQLLFAASSAGQIDIWHLLDKTTLGSLRGTHSVRQIELAPDFAFAMTVESEKIKRKLAWHLRIWSLTSFDSVYDAVFPGDVNAIAITADWSRALVADDDCRTYLWNLAAGEVIDVLEGHQQGVTSCAFVAGDRKALTGASDAYVILWNLPN